MTLLPTLRRPIYGARTPTSWPLVSPAAYAGALSRLSGDPVNVVYLPPPTSESAIVVLPTATTALTVIRTIALNRIAITAKAWPTTTITNAIALVITTVTGTATSYGTAGKGPIDIAIARTTAAAISTT